MQQPTAPVCRYYGRESTRSPLHTLGSGVLQLGDPSPILSEECIRGSRGAFFRSRLFTSERKANAALRTIQAVWCLPFPCRPYAIQIAIRNTWYKQAYDDEVLCQRSKRDYKPGFKP